MNISIVIPLLNEAESLPELTEWIAAVMNREGYSYEIWFIDDGSTDESWSIIENLRKTFPEVKGIRFQRNYGKSAALQVGFERAIGDIVFTMDADLQDSPDEIPSMYRRMMEEHLDLLSGWKKKRYDPLTKTLPTKLFNAATRAISGVKNLHDFNCGLKAYRLEVVRSIEVYGEMHRYIPVIARWAGFGRIDEQVVQHRPRKYGHTKFGLDRFVNGFLDLLSIYFMSKFSRRPMHFFGTMG
ncbi:MAG: glycosyltransferase family 2 protein, partial [Bacteroidota bacterium]